RDLGVLALGSLGGLGILALGGLAALALGRGLLLGDAALLALGVRLGGLVPRQGTGHEDRAGRRVGDGGGVDVQRRLLLRRHHKEDERHRDRQQERPEPDEDQRRDRRPPPLGTTLSCHRTSSWCRTYVCLRPPGAWARDGHSAEP